MLRGRSLERGCPGAPQGPPLQLWLPMGQPQAVPLAAVPVAWQEQAGVLACAGCLRTPVLNAGDGWCNSHFSLYVTGFSLFPSG